MAPQPQLKEILCAELFEVSHTQTLKHYPDSSETEVLKLSNKTIERERIMNEEVRTLDT